MAILKEKTNWKKKFTALYSQRINICNKALLEVVKEKM